MITLELDIDPVLEKEFKNCQKILKKMKWKLFKGTRQVLGKNKKIRQVFGSYINSILSRFHDLHSVMTVHNCSNTNYTVFLYGSTDLPKMRRV